MWIEIVATLHDEFDFGVTSLAEVWIEIKWKLAIDAINCVTSLAEVWIEIKEARLKSGLSQSLPLRKCGLKYLQL